MNFLFRSFLGLFLFALTVGLVVLAGAQVFWAINESQQEEQRFPPTQEREFTVNVDKFTPTSVVPVITAYGNVKSWRTLQLRTTVGGAVVEMSPNLRDGGIVTAGEVLLQIDPSKAESALSLSRIDLSEAEAELVEAQDSLSGAEAELALAVSQRDLRVQALTRQQDLKARGVGTDADIETAQLALASAEQALLNLETSLTQAKSRIARAKISVERQEIAVAEAERTLQESTITAQFDGIINDVTAALGGIVSANEVVGSLLDPTALEVAFRVSNTQYSRLLDENGELRILPVEMVLELDNLPFTITGQIAREDAEVGEGQSGRVIYAQLTEDVTGLLRPGDFVTVSIREPEMQNMFVIPSTAAASDGRVLVVGEENRLDEINVDILRRQGNQLIVANAPAGVEYVTARSPQIGLGIKIKPLRSVDGQVVVEEAEPELITLDDERRARLISFVESNDRMPEEIKTRILTQLSEPEVPKDVVERLESRMGG